MSNIDKRALHQLATRATPGPWEEENGEVWIMRNDTATSILTGVCGDDTSGQQDFDNARFIAAANPETMLALLDELEAKDDALADMYQAATGERPEWSNLFQFSDAVEEVRQNVNAWISRAQSAEKRVAELEAREVAVNLPDRRDENYDWDGATPTEAFNTCLSICSLMFGQSLRAAGIKIAGDVGETEVRKLTAAATDVLVERERQQSVEGWTPEHDDQYGKSQLLWASSCYLLNTIQPFNRIPMDWPWDSSWWKPTSTRRDLVKAGALIIAEIERRDRAAGADKQLS